MNTDPIPGVHVRVLYDRPSHETWVRVSYTRRQIPAQMRVQQALRARTPERVIDGDWSTDERTDRYVFLGRVTV